MEALSEEDRQELETAIAKLRKAGERDTDAKTLQNDLKEFQHRVDRHLPIWKNSTVREYVEVVVTALILALFIRSFVFQAFKIPSGSMIPTLLVGDHLVVNKFIYGFEVPFMDKKILPFSRPKRGDIIVFKFPNDPSKDFIKRVIGIPGDKIEVRGKQVYVNDEPLALEREGTYDYVDTFEIEQSAELLDEKIGEKTHAILLSSHFSGADQGPWYVPEHKYFCMGDNRDHSNDSRYWGFVDFDAIRGKAMFIYFSWPPRQLTRIFSGVH
ncbi:MAG: signal peptidase I [Deltaproteobacteria bacterium]|nr:signal peptidase I [bacterium]MCB9475983.1 signal peptidase I [Deltaproteobacteria bacterium]MCB9480061.1 signal peptidase I [Deltaproteobacteria bacterium]MCB9487119.1 signal peptidase I [Deltaproteobacteria bacterium]